MDKTDDTTTIAPCVSRHAKFLDVVSKAIRKSHEAISIATIIEQCYGEDAAIFETEGEEHENLLVGLLDAALEKIDQELLRHIEHVVKEYGVDKKLICLDTVIAKVEDMEKKAQEAEEHDRQSTQDAIRMSKIPDGISIDDVMLYQAYLIHKSARDELRESLAKAKTECEEIRGKVEEQRLIVKERIDALDDRNISMSNAADLCSFNGMS